MFNEVVDDWKLSCRRAHTTIEQEVPRHQVTEAESRVEEIARCIEQQQPRYPLAGHRPLTLLKLLVAAIYAVDAVDDEPHGKRAKAVQQDHGCVER